jgi:hypothetical protein
MVDSNKKMPAELSIDERVAKTRRRIDLVKQFMKDIENVGGKVPPSLKRAVNRYLLAIKMGVDAAEAANEVSRELRAIYEDMYSISRIPSFITLLCLANALA